MEGGSKGYVPPKGSAGGEARGAFSYKKNPRPVPMKGSSISGESEFGQNADKEKVVRMKNEEAKKESLRGYGC